MNFSARTYSVSTIYRSGILFMLIAISAALISRPARSSAAEKEPDKVQQMTEGMHEAFMEFGEMVGGLSAEQKTKVDALEKKLSARLKANPSEADDARAFQQKAMGQFREILTAEQKAKFDEQMHASAERAAVVLTGSNLRQIGMAAMKYAGDHKDVLPPKLGALVSATLEPRMFLAGNSTTKLPANLDKFDAKAKAVWVNENSDFVWLGAAKKQADLPANFVLAYVKVAAPQKSFLMGDGSVQTLDPDPAAKVEADLKLGKNPPPSFGQK